MAQIHRSDEFANRLLIRVVLAAFQRIDVGAGPVNEYVLHAPKRAAPETHAQKPEKHLVGRQRFLHLVQAPAAGVKHLRSAVRVSANQVPIERSRVRAYRVRDVPEAHLPIHLSQRQSSRRASRPRPLFVHFLRLVQLRRHVRLHRRHARLKIARRLPLGAQRAVVHHHARQRLDDSIRIARLSRLKRHRHRKRR